jgi:hypothetical protein
MNKLKEYSLIWEQRRGRGLANHIYLASVKISLQDSLPQKGGPLDQPGTAGMGNTAKVDNVTTAGNMAAASNTATTSQTVITMAAEKTRRKHSPGTL